MPAVMVAVPNESGRSATPPELTLGGLADWPGAICKATEPASEGIVVVVTRLATCVLTLVTVTLSGPGAPARTACTSLSPPVVPADCGPTCTMNGSSGVNAVVMLGRPDRATP